MVEKTRNFRIWIMYISWHIVAWMNKHKPCYPMWIRIYFYKHFGVDLVYTPLIKPWRYIERIFMKIRGNHAHKSDFTDKKDGLLYGGSGETMNNLWHEFMRRINYDDN